MTNTQPLQLPTHGTEPRMSLFTAQLHPGQALGFLVLRASLHDIITRLKAEPQRFPSLELIYDQESPVTEPVIVNLPSNGLRLRFDGPQQRLRLIEVLDFTKSHLTYKDQDVLRPAPKVPQAVGHSGSLRNPEVATGPTFKHIYSRLFGVTFQGEYIEPEGGHGSGTGLYILSYPGVAFSFPTPRSILSANSDFVTLLSSPKSHPAVSMALFHGQSWPKARGRLYTDAIEPRRYLTTLSKGSKVQENVPEEVRLIRIHGEGKLELRRPGDISAFWIKLGLTSPQDLVAVLGPPDAIYRKNDRRMSIHKARQGTETGDHSDLHDSRVVDDSTDTDQSSAHTATDDSEDEDEEGEVAGSVSEECFYNYFYHGFDILLSSPSTPSRCPPSKAGVIQESNSTSTIPADSSKRLVASKLILHGNVPGSYPFNRHRRCRWEIEYLNSKNGQPVVNSETPFGEIEHRLHEEWKSIYKDEEEAKSLQRGMVLNRDWGDSPGSSCELLGGWEDSVGGKRAGHMGSEDAKGLGNTTLFGFPGLVFEVLKNNTVSGLTVF